MIFLSFRRKKRPAHSATRQPLPQAATAGRALSFAVDISPLFRSYDIESMEKYGIDLSSYEDVKDHAQDIYWPVFPARKCPVIVHGAKATCNNSRTGWRTAWNREATESSLILGLRDRIPIQSLSCFTLLASLLFGTL